MVNNSRWIGISVYKTMPFAAFTRLLISQFTTIGKKIKRELAIYDIIPHTIIGKGVVRLSSSSFMSPPVHMAAALLMLSRHL